MRGAPSYYFSQPVVVNRYLQSIIRHPSFSRWAGSASSTRRPLVYILHTLFHRYPTNTCQPTHISPLVGIYTGTQCDTDVKLLDIFRLYEENKKVSAAGFVLRWSTSEGVPVNPLQAILNLDPSQVFRTCLAFSAHRGPAAVSTRDEQHNSLQRLYEPSFILSLCAQFLVGDLSSSSLSDWTAFFRTNATCVIIRTLSSNDLATRQIAVAQLAALANLLPVSVTVYVSLRPHLDLSNRQRSSLNAHMSTTSSDSSNLR